MFLEDDSKLKKELEAYKIMFEIAEKAMYGKLETIADASRKINKMKAELNTCKPFMRIKIS